MPVQAYFRINAKNMARSVLKAGATEAARREFGELGGLAMNILSLATETADTRSWSLLPALFYVTRARLPVGRHNVEIIANGKLKSIEIIDIKDRSIHILRDK